VTFHITYAAVRQNLFEHYLNHDSDCVSFACQFSEGGDVVSNCYITLGGGLEKCYTVLQRVGG